MIGLALTSPKIPAPGQPGWPALYAEGRKKLAQYMLRAPFSLEKMTYLPETGMVMYRSHMHKGLKRNFQLMPGAKEPARATGGRKGYRRTKTAAARMDLPSRPRHRLSC